MLQDNRNGKSRPSDHSSTSSFPQYRLLGDDLEAMVAHSKHVQCPSRSITASALGSSAEVAPVVTRRDSSSILAIHTRHPEIYAIANDVPSLVTRLTFILRTQ